MSSGWFALDENGFKNYDEYDYTNVIILVNEYNNINTFFYDPFEINELQEIQPER